MFGTARIDRVLIIHMVAFERANTGPYKCSAKLIDVANIANKEKVVPLDWMTSEGNNFL